MRRERSGKAYAALAVALVALAYVLWRSSVGASLFDDGQYAALVLRFAQGARPVADEWTLQSFGFLLAVPFAYVWKALFGLQGLVLALRWFYVTLATVVGYFSWRWLRPWLGALPAALGIVPVSLAPPYAIWMVSYNTICVLGFLLASALAYSALHDQSRVKAVGAGVALAVGAVSYPPMVLAAAAFIAAYAVLDRRSSRNWLWALGAAAGTELAFSASMVMQAPLHDLAVLLRYSGLVWTTLAPAGARLSGLETWLLRGIFSWPMVPMWLAALLASLPVVPRAVRRWLLALMPLFGAIPAIAFAVHTGHAHVESGPRGLDLTAASYLCYFTIAAGIPVLVDALREERAELTRLFALVAPSSLVGAIVVAAATTAGPLWGLPVVGLAPLAVAVVAGWWTVIAEIPAAARALALSALLVALVYPSATSTFFGPAPWRTVRITNGAYAGITASPETAAGFRAVEEFASRQIPTTSDVTFVWGPAGYLLTAGRADTNATFLVTGASDAYLVGYWQKHRRWPDFVFVSDYAIAAGLQLSDSMMEARIAHLERHDPLVRVLADRYRLLGRVGDYFVWKYVPVK